LGFSRLEIEQHLEEVIDFAEIRDFIDAPLRTYSTGMNARLGFSVATCIRPDILLIDEVLSVGDVAFQEKCIDRMNRFRALGTTIIIVSHDMRTIRDFCERALWLDQGRIQKIGNVVEITEKYIEYGHVI
jgi:lipopolysaccharide transport system ATP-binding protein